MSPFLQSGSKFCEHFFKKGSFFKHFEILRLVGLSQRVGEFLTSKFKGWPVRAELTPNSTLCFFTCYLPKEIQVDFEVFFCLLLSIVSFIGIVRLHYPFKNFKMLKFWFLYFPFVHFLTLKLYYRSIF